MKLKRNIFFTAVFSFLMTGVLGEYIQPALLGEGAGSGIRLLYADGSEGGTTGGGSGSDPNYCPGGCSPDEICRSGTCVPNSSGGGSTTSNVAFKSSMPVVITTAAASVLAASSGMASASVGIMCQGVSGPVPVTATVTAGGLSRVLTFMLTCISCGNTIVDAQFGEDCDDGNKINTDGCNNACRRCGNHIEEDGEQCDDGNQNPCDNCSNNCRVPAHNCPLIRCGPVGVEYPDLAECATTETYDVNTNTCICPTGGCLVNLDRPC